MLETASGGLQGIRREDVDNRNGKSSGFVEEIGGSIAVSDILFNLSVVPLPNHCQNENFNKKGEKGNPHRRSAVNRRCFQRCTQILLGRYLLQHFSGISVKQLLVSEFPQADGKWPTLVLNRTPNT